MEGPKRKRQYCWGQRESQVSRAEAEEEPGKQLKADTSSKRRAGASIRETEAKSEVVETHPTTRRSKSLGARG